jgi:chromosome segregation ATPase
VDCPAGSLVGQLVDVDPVGSLSDGLSSLPAEVRPCCPDAGDDSGRCHGQPFGACRCYACLRLERRLLPAIVRDVAHTFQAAALPMAEKRYRRRQFARLVAQLRGRAQAAERRLEWAEAVVAGQAADLSRLTAELVAAQNGRDDALMQASAAAERASVAEREAAAACERASRYEESRDEAEKRVEELEEELSALRERGRVVRPEAGDWTEEEAAASERMVRRVERATGRKPEGES